MRGRAHYILPFALVGVLASIPSALASNYVQCPVTTVNPVVQKGKRLFDSVTGEYFPIKGIAYYPRPNEGSLAVSNSVDFFTEEWRSIWEADIENFRKLGVNTIRIYAVDPSKNHDAFMCKLQEAGIYVIIGLLADCKDCAIGPNAAPSCYPKSLKLRGQFVINEFSRYSNTLLFSAGNEVTIFARDKRIELNAACQKKFLRDMRDYVQTCSAIPASILPRPVPIGMVNWDNQRDLQTLYFNCRTDPDDDLENAEWYGLNSYQHCNPGDTEVEDLSGWIKLREDFARYNIEGPAIIAEFGCRERFPRIGRFEAQRPWTQIDALYTDEYLDVFAGGVVYEYSAEKKIVELSSQGNPWPYFGFMKLQYGVGYFGPVDCDHNTTACEYFPYPEFTTLGEKYDAVDVSSISDMSSYVPTGEVPTCPDELPPIADFEWPSDDEPDLPCYVVPTPAPSLSPTFSQVPSILPSSSPSLSGAPSTSPSTLSPTAEFTPSPTKNPTMMPTSVLATIDAPAAFEDFGEPTSVLGSIDAPAAFDDFNKDPTVPPTQMPIDTTISPAEDILSAAASNPSNKLASRLFMVLSLFGTLAL